MTEPRSPAAGYAICIVLAAPMLMLGCLFAGILGLVGVLIGACVTAACIVAARTMQRHAATHQP